MIRLSLPLEAIASFPVSAHSLKQCHGQYHSGLVQKEDRFTSSLSSVCSLVSMDRTHTIGSLGAQLEIRSTRCGYEVLGFWKSWEAKVAQSLNFDECTMQNWIAHRRRLDIKKVRAKYPIPTNCACPRSQEAGYSDISPMYSGNKANGLLLTSSLKSIQCNPRKLVLITPCLWSFPFIKKARVFSMLASKGEMLCFLETCRLQQRGWSWGLPEHL